MTEETKVQTAQQIYERFRMPFPLDSIKFRIGATNKRQTNPDPPTRGIPLPYIDARDVMTRLDNVVGFDGWQTDMAFGSDGILACKLSVLIDGQWIVKTDVAGETGTHGNFDKSDSQKGSGSDGLKRAAVQFHIGRYLYWIKPNWIDLVEGSLPPDKTILELVYPDGTPLWPSWASPAGWKREVLKLDGNPLSEQERMDLAASMIERRKAKGDPAIDGVLKMLGYTQTENFEGWTTGMFEKFDRQVGTLPDVN